MPRFPESQLFDPNRQVVLFTAYVGPDLIPCAISLEALQDHFGADNLAPERAFIRNRAPIESIAARLIERDRREPDGSILIRTADC